MNVGVLGKASFRIRNPPAVGRMFKQTSQKVGAGNDRRQSWVQCVVGNKTARAWWMTALLVELAAKGVAFIARAESGAETPDLFMSRYCAYVSVQRRC